ncbi:MAG: dihydroxy-acid dehydratase, partial [Candidatus Limnocylindrus sp.]
IALIEEGDTITIDVAAHELRLDVDPATLARRRAAWRAPAPNYTGGVWAKYAALVSSASDGAITTGKRLKRTLESAAEQ